MIKSKKLALAFAAAITLGATNAHAQGAPQTRALTVQYSGVITNDVADTLMIRQPDGTFARYTGTVPNYAYNKGDAVTVSFTTTVPTGAYYDANNVPRSADGIYRFFVQGPLGQGGTFGKAVADISGPLGASSNYASSGITVVFDSNSDTYSLEFPNDRFSIGYFSGASFLYDVNSGALLPTSRNCFTAGGCDTGAYIQGDATDIKLTSDTGRADGSADPVTLGPSGSFTLGFKGSWNLPTYSATQVPEPASIGLFAGGLALLQRARRRKHRLQA
jgi:PEP-CTERM motif